VDGCAITVQPVISWGRRLPTEGPWTITSQRLPNQIWRSPVPPRLATDAKTLTPGRSICCMKERKIEKVYGEREKASKRWRDSERERERGLLVGPVICG
jgi:hypothetical protein